MSRFLAGACKRCVLLTVVAPSFASYTAFRPLPFRPVNWSFQHSSLAGVPSRQRPFVQFAKVHSFSVFARQHPDLAQAVRALPAGSRAAHADDEPVRLLPPPHSSVRRPEGRHRFDSLGRLPGSACAPTTRGPRRHPRKSGAIRDGFDPVSSPAERWGSGCPRYRRGAACRRATDTRTHVGHARTWAAHHRIMGNSVRARRGTRFVLTPGTASRKESSR